MTAEATRPVRRRGIFRLDEEILGRIIDLPEGQRIIGFRPDPARLCIDVCIEGEGLPECPPVSEPYVVNAEPYTARFSRWATRGRDLEEMLDVVLRDREDDNPAAAAIRTILDGSYDPRVRHSTVAVEVEYS